jgi:hypothetical protein
MALASSSKMQLVYIEESTPGTTPGTGTPKYLRNTGEKLAYTINAESSKEINATRQVSDRVHVGATTDGGIDIELSYREYDPFLEALLANTFSTSFGTDGIKSITVSFDATANTITDDAAAGSFAGLVAGQWISVMNTAGHNGVYRIASMTNDVLTIDSDTPLPSTASGVAADISGSRLSVGTAALRTFSIEKRFTDVTQFFVYRGMAVSKLALQFAAGSLLTGSIDFMGFNSERGGSTFMPGTPSASQPHGIMNAVTGVGKVLIDHAPIAGTYVKSMDVAVDAKLRGQDAIGYLGNVGIGEGTFEIGGTLEIYLNDGSIYDDALANNTLSVEIPVKDVNNNGYTFVFDNVKLDVPTVQAGSIDNDVMLSVPFTAVAPDTSTDKMLHIDRYGVALV